jgi:hypothetical protein
MQANMNLQAFIHKWSNANLKERSAVQEHFIDLCRMLGEKTPAEADPEGIEYTFEKGVDKTSGGSGFVDVWMRRHFAWEYKGNRADLNAAYQQLLQYREALENPPLLVVCDLNRFEIHMNVNGRPNSDVIRPVASAVDLVRHSRGKWTIDFGVMSFDQAVLYEMPFEYVKEQVYLIRAKERRDDFNGE